MANPPMNAPPILTSGRSASELSSAGSDGVDHPEVVASSGVAGLEG
jgi:hypothetical protein